MSEWVNKYVNHQFHTQWETFKVIIFDIESKDYTDANIIESISRLKKITSFIDDLFQGIDPELAGDNIFNYLNDINTNIQNAKSNIDAFLSNNNITHLNNTHSYINKIIDRLSTSIIYPSSAKKSLLNAVRIYIKEIDSHLKNILDTNKEYEIAQELNKEIQVLHDFLLTDSEEELSVKSKINSMYDEVENKYEKINTFFIELLDDEDKESIKTLVENSKDNIVENSKEANEKLIEISTKIDELKKFYVKIFGELNDEGKRENGLNQELILRIKELDNFKKSQEEEYTILIKNKTISFDKYEKEQKEKYKKLYEYIESLVPGATSAGLAKSYQDMKDTFKTPIKIWGITFITSLIFMFIAALISFITIEGTDKTWSIHFIQATDYKVVLNSLLYKLPLYGPLVWLALYASKRRSEYQKLKQDYAHKEALAKSYISYKQQIEELDIQDNDLLNKLMDSSITTISKNSSDFLDKNSSDLTPVGEFSKIVIDEVKKIIPKSNT